MPLRTKLEQQKGIVLHTLRFGDYDLIATVFTHECGLIKLMVKGGMSLKKKTPLTALTCAEFVYTMGKSELHICKEAAVIERFYGGTANFQQLQAGCTLAQALRLSQMLEKPAPKLYELFFLFLRILPQATHVDTWVCSFLLKILKHEGLSDTYDFCAACSAPLIHAYVSKGEGFCKAHAPVHAITFTSEEMHLITLLTNSRSLTEIGSVEAHEIFTSKIKTLFQHSLDLKRGLILECGNSLPLC